MEAELRDGLGLQQEDLENLDRAKRVTSSALKFLFNI